MNNTHMIEALALTSDVAKNLMFGSIGVILAASVLGALIVAHLRSKHAQQRSSPLHPAE